MSNIRIYVGDESKNYLTKNSSTGLTKIVTLLEPVSENSNVKVYLDGHEYTNCFTNLLEFNNQHGGAGNLIGRYAFNYQTELENIIVKVDVDTKFLSTEAINYLERWKNNIQDLVREVEGNFGVNYVRKYLLYSMYGFNEYEKTNYENIADIFIKNYDKVIKYYNYITSSKIFKNTVSNMYSNEYVESNSIKSDIYNDIFRDQNPDVQWHEKNYIEYNTPEVQYLRYMFYKFILLIDKCIKSLSKLDRQSNNTVSNITYADTLDLLQNIKKKFSVIAVNCRVSIPKRALTNKKYRFIYKIYSEVYNKSDLLKDFSKYLEVESLDIINYMNKSYEISLFQKIANITCSKIKEKPECRKSVNGLLYKFVSNDDTINVYFPFNRDLSDINLESNIICGRESNLDIIVSSENNNKLIGSFIVDAKYKYYGFYDKYIGQMVRYANAVIYNNSHMTEFNLPVVSDCYLVFPFSKDNLNDMTVFDKKYHMITDDLFNDIALASMLDYQLPVIEYVDDRQEYIEQDNLDFVNTYKVNNEVYRMLKKSVEYNKDGSIKTFNIPTRAESKLFETNVYRVDNNNNHWFRWGNYASLYNLTSILLDKTYEIKVSDDRELPAIVLEYAHIKDSEKAVDFMNSVEWCARDKRYKFFNSHIKGTGYNYNLDICTNNTVNRVAKILLALDIELEFLLQEGEFYSIFRTVDLDKCYQSNINREKFISVIDIRQLMLVGETDIENICINEFNFKVSTLTEALYVLLCYLVFIVYVDIDNMLDANIISTNILNYRRPNVISSTNLFFEQDGVGNNLIAVMETISKMYDVDIKLKINEDCLSK